MKLSLHNNLAIVFLISTILSCNNGADKQPTPGSANATSPGNKELSLSGRKNLVEEIKRLKVLFTSGNKEKIKSIFQFPLPDSTLAYYLEDKSFDEDKKQSPDFLTEALFDRYYDKISKSIELDRFNAFFEHIPADSLLVKDRVQTEVADKDEPCMQFYDLSYEEGQLSITIGSNHNTNYVNKSKSEEDDSVGDACEYAVIWEFTFDGKRLLFKRQTAAG